MEFLNAIRKNVSGGFRSRYFFVLAKNRWRKEISLFKSQEERIKSCAEIEMILPVFVVDK